MLQVNRHTLANGLRLVHNYDPTTAMAAVNVLYLTGGRDETPELTGIAHLMEHVMFGGSQHVTDFDAVMSAAGGTNNAWTSKDFTSFWNIVPAQNIETLFYLESDRMLCPTLSQTTVDTQKSVVIEEFKQQCLNRPYGQTMPTLSAAAYPTTHPYSWQTLGKTPDHVAKATPADLRQWWQHNYAPANAVLAVGGNITFDKAVALAEKYFGDITFRTPPRHIYPAIPDLTADRQIVIEDNVPSTLITMAWLMDSYGTTAYTAADAITDILSAGNASRFYRRLIVEGDGRFADVDASIVGSELRGLLMINARLASEDIDIATTVDLLTSQARRLANIEPPTPREVERLKNRQSSLFTLGNIDYLSCTQTIAMAEAHNEDPDTQLKRYLALIADDIVDTANWIFNNSHHIVLITRPRHNDC